MLLQLQRLGLVRRLLCGDGIQLLLLLLLLLLREAAMIRRFALLLPLPTALQCETAVAPSIL